MPCVQRRGTALSAGGSPEAVIATFSGVPHDRGSADIALPESDRERAEPDAVKGIRVAHFREIVHRCGFAFEGRRGPQLVGGVGPPDPRFPLCRQGVCPECTVD
ncbi:hypothetical protein GZL_05788 [Streptomyces sp. 769]|nr:hypothetical protein GZL_05788 [Streptomyces sp. 769]